MSQPSAHLPPDEDQRKLVGPVAIVFDLLLTAAFFVFMMWVAYDHTPDVSDQAKLLISAYTSSCISGVFWLVVQGFRVTLVDQLRQKAKG